MCIMTIPTMENCTYLTFLKMDMFTIDICIPQLNEIRFQQNLKKSLVAFDHILFWLNLIKISQNFLLHNKHQYYNFDLWLLCSHFGNMEIATFIMFEMCLVVLKVLCNCLLIDECQNLLQPFKTMLSNEFNLKVSIIQVTKYIPSSLFLFMIGISQWNLDYTF